MFRTRIEDRYIFFNFSSFLLAVICLSITLFVVIDAVPIVSRYQPSFNSLFQYYIYLLPKIFLTLIPIACTIAVFLCFAHLSRRRELMAFFSLGISFKRMCRPIFIFLGFICLFSLWLTHKVAPHFSQKKDYVYFVEIRKNPDLYSSVNADKIWYRSSHIIFNIENFNDKSFHAQGLTLYYFDPQRWVLSQIIYAEKVEMQEELWTLENGRSTIFIPESDFPLTKAFHKKVITMNESLKDLRSSSRPFDTMDLKQMRRFIKKKEKLDLDTTQQELEFHKKISFSFASFTASFLILPFALSFNRPSYRRKDFSKTGMVIFLSALYWVVFLSLINLGKNGVLPPLLATWGSHLIALGVGGYLFYKLK